MSLSSLNDLYRQLVLDHGQQPHHFTVLSHPDHHFNLSNSSCGDQIDLQLKLSSDQKQLTNIAFQGSGCTLSTASASIMTDTVWNLPVKQVKQDIQLFQQMILTGKVTDQMEACLGDATVFVSVHKVPSRITCVTLAWHALDKALTSSSQEETFKPFRK